MNLTPGSGESQNNNGSMNITSEVARVLDAYVYPRSIVEDQQETYLLIRRKQQKQLAILQPSTPEHTNAGDTYPVDIGGHKFTVHLHALDQATAILLRNKFTWLVPTTLGLGLSIGCGDRLGLATPGHIRALRECGHQMAPILAQQSIREMARTKRTPQQVIDDAMWGVFQEGWHGGYGADADHLKTFEDIDRCVAAGYTFYTFDPGAHVDNEYDVTKYSALPWSELEATGSDTHTRYKAKFDEYTIEHAFVKYGQAIAHVTRMYRYLKRCMLGRPFEVEVSVDETEQPTSHAEHFMVAAELRRLGVAWVSLAPRFVGRFEKGVDYIGDLKDFEVDFAGHVGVARELGPYKLSIHSGSDKFSIYPIVSKLAGANVHLKTAGTSYLEAIRTIARCDRSLFQAIYELARARYDVDRATYHVSARPSRAPSADMASIANPADILDQFDARQMLHVCFGSILENYGTEMKQVLNAYEEQHYDALQHHLQRHLQSFCI